MSGVRASRGVCHGAGARRAASSSSSSGVTGAQPATAGNSGEPGDHRAQPRVPCRVGDTVRRVGRVDGYVGRAGLEYGEQGDDQFRGALQADAHPVAGRDSALPQAVRQQSRPLVELAVGESGAPSVTAMRSGVAAAIRANASGTVTGVVVSGRDGRPSAATRSRSSSSSRPTSSAAVCG